MPVSLSLSLSLSVCFFCRFLVGLADHPEMIRNIAVAGNLHAGKTILFDMLVQQTHDKKWSLSKNVRRSSSCI